MADRPPPHIPVLYQPVLSALRPAPGRRFLDGTVGAGGHAWGLLEASAPDGEVLGLDRDPGALRLAAERLRPFGVRAHLHQASFAEMQAVTQAVGWDQVDGVLLDLGMSSMQVDDPARGFSFLHDGPLDMRFDPQQPQTAADLVNNLQAGELVDVLTRFGEEPRARRVAQAIVAARPIRTTRALAEIVAMAAGYKGGRTHPATRTFQALRIAVNDELAALEQGLQQAIDLLRPGGRMAVIAFHSLEDRLVKQFMRRESTDCVCPPRQPVCTCDHHASLRLIARSPIRADADEVSQNPRARSARLRVAERLGMA
jgi:16S rRNA (cytosine1402-N4)-methyltransferase